MSGIGNRAWDGEAKKTAVVVRRVHFFLHFPPNFFNLHALVAEKLAARNHVGTRLHRYRPSTYTMSGLTAWCVGGNNRGGLAPRNVTSYVAECAPCPADWGWDQ